tara:strand:+ start:207 stop:947 length:741 start_codon:yes stop_codon:yes gene_type:complete
MSQTYIQRYTRQIKLPHIGAKGQQKIMTSKVCVVGCGGLGNPILTKLVAMGVGKIQIIDRDRVEESNLHRQTLFDEDDIGKYKTDVLKEKLEKLNPHCIIEKNKMFFTELDANVLQGYDVVVDGLDTIGSRQALNKACVNWNIPLVTGAATDTRGQVFTVIPKETSCYSCNFGHFNLEELAMATCDVQGVDPSILSIISGLQVSETINIICGNKPQLTNKILHIDLDGMNFTMTDTFINKDCKVCK